MTEPDAEFLVIFKDEANERLDHIVDTLLAFETGRAAADAIDGLFRDAHTIKGAAGMLGLDEARARAGGPRRRTCSTSWPRDAPSSWEVGSRSRARRRARARTGRRLGLR